MKVEFDFEFEVPFKRGIYNIKIRKWKFTDEKKYGRKVNVQGYGIDGQLYDGVANITSKGLVKNIIVDVYSGRWE